LKTHTFVLVHGAWHDSRCWALLAPLLQAHGHRVLTPDLPGHGQSTLPPARSTLKAYVQALCDVVESCSEPVILLGHSMAGIAVTETAVRLPTRIHRLVYLCAYLPQPGDSVFTLIARNRGHEPLSAIELALAMSDDKRTCSIDTGSIIPLFYSNVPAVDAAQLQQRFCLQGSLPLAATAQFDPAQLVGLRRHYVCCTQDRVIPLHHQLRMLATNGDCTVHRLVADHSPFFSCPSELAALLLTLG
jgi:pimeloyl-ACP methyl ester carboxylesterase